ncbi:MAG: ABC transporter permease [Acidobacteria bacterium]|nr:ABC transporter permease [Acidobacteriota bacterium]
MDNLLKDLRYALRGLARQPGFTLLTVLTLALGIGANTAIFSVVNGVLLRPLPYPHPEQLEYITTKFPALGFEQFWMSPPEMLELEAHNQSFSSIGGFSAGAVNVNTAQPSRPNSALVTPNLMKTLGVPPLKGRWFNDEDARPGAADTAILSAEFWQRHFGSDAGILGRQLLIDNVSTTIVGVMPPGYDVHDQKVEIWLPLTIDPATLSGRRGNHFLYVVARRKDNVSPQQARADITQMQTHWQDFVGTGTAVGHLFRPNLPNGHVLRIDPLKADIVGSARTALLVLQGAVALVLLIACANLANLLLARAESRQREFAIRSALGAARKRLFSQFVTEGLVLSVLAAMGGVGLAWLALRGLLTVNPDAIPRSVEVGLDWRVLLFTLVITIATGFVFGLAPLSNLSKRLIATLRDGTRTTGGRTQKLVRGSLVIAEVTLAVVLVASAGLLVRSLSNLLTVDAGFNRSQLVTFGVVLPPATYNPQQRAEFFARLERELGALPGVEGVASMAGLPPNRQVNANDTDFEHIPNNAPPGSPLPIENVDYWQNVTEHYTQTMGIPVVRGRGFEPGDITGAPVALVNESLVKRFFTSQNREPLGATFKPGFGPTLPAFTIVGIVKDVKQAGVDAPVGTEIYFLVEQGPRVIGRGPTSMNVVMRTKQPLAVLGSSIERTVRQLDAGLPIVKLRTMDDVFGDSVSRPKFITLLLAIFAGLALTLAAIGTYGVLSYLVTQQSQEIGIRMALGASRGNVLGLILKQGLMLTAIGLTFGVAGAFAAGRLMRSLLFNVSPSDPLTIGGVALVMAIVATAACLIPALRATRVDPLQTLRR